MHPPFFFLTGGFTSLPDLGLERPLQSLERQVVAISESKTLRAGLGQETPPRARP